jgi:molecular chaperone HtpG
VILHINEESEEFLDEYKIRIYPGKILSFPSCSEFSLKTNRSIIPIPAWKKKPSELTTQDYQDFYKELYSYNETPLFWIHLNVDYPFNLTGILYFPRIKQSYESRKTKFSYTATRFL